MWAVTLCCGPSVLGRPASVSGEPITKLPPGIEIISMVMLPRLSVKTCACPWLRLAICPVELTVTVSKVKVFKPFAYGCGPILSGSSGGAGVTSGVGLFAGDSLSEEGAEDLLFNKL